MLFRHSGNHWSPSAGYPWQVAPPQSPLVVLPANVIVAAGRIIVKFLSITTPAFWLFELLGRRPIGLLSGPGPNPPGPQVYLWA